MEELYGPSAQLIVTAFLCGLIWTVQVVHYPSFHYVAEKDFSTFHDFHSRRITYVVMLPMIFELLTALISFVHTPSAMALSNAALAVVLWAVTFFISVPLHNKLAHQRNEATIDRLVRTNWLRTLLWSCKLALLCVSLKG